MLRNNPKAEAEGKKSKKKSDVKVSYRLGSSSPGVARSNATEAMAFNLGRVDIATSARPVVLMAIETEIKQEKAQPEEHQSETSFSLFSNTIFNEIDQLKKEKDEEAERCFMQRFNTG